MSESYEVPTYRQNQLIHAEVRFRHAPGVERVVAYFRHQVNPYVHHALFGHVVSRSGDVYVARLAGKATVIEESYGEHRCESLYVELEDGRTISFASVPDIRFEIVPSDTPEAAEQRRSNEPVLLDWNWEQHCHQVLADVRQGINPCSESPRELPERRNRAASLRIYMDGYVPGGRSENVIPTSQGQSPIVPRRFFRFHLSHNVAS